MTRSKIGSHIPPAADPPPSSRAIKVAKGNLCLIDLATLTPAQGLPLHKEKNEMMRYVSKL